MGISIDKLIRHENQELFSKSSNSPLKERILLALNVEPAKSVTALAKLLNSLRPSISRAINNLEKDGLIIRTGRSIALSETGKKAIEELEITLAWRSEKIKATLNILTQQQQQFGGSLSKNFTEFQSKNFAEMIKSITSVSGESLTGMEAIIENTQALSKNFIKGSSLNKILEETSHSARNALFLNPGLSLIDQVPISGLMSSLGESGIFAKTATPTFFSGLDSLTSSLSKPIFNPSYIQEITKPFKDSLLSLINVQEMNQKWFKETFASVNISSGLNALIRENNVAISRLVADYDAISRIKPLNLLFEGLIQEATKTTNAFSNYFLNLPTPNFGSIDNSIIDPIFYLPTKATTKVISSARHIIEYEATYSAIDGEEDDIEILSDPSVGKFYYEHNSPIVEALLKDLGNNFVELWHGAWHTLQVGGPGHKRHAAHSGRELFIQVLEFMAPDSQFTQEEIKKYGEGTGKVTHTMRIKRSLGADLGKGEFLPDNLATMLKKIYRVLTAASHNREPIESFSDFLVAEWLMTLGSQLELLLISYKNNLK